MRRLLTTLLLSLLLGLLWQYTKIRSVEMQLGNLSAAYDRQAWQIQKLTEELEGLRRSEPEETTPNMTLEDLIQEYLGGDTA